MTSRDRLEATVGHDVGWDVEVYDCPVHGRVFDFDVDDHGDCRNTRTIRDYQRRRDPFDLDEYGTANSPGTERWETRGDRPYSAMRQEARRAL